MSRVAVELEQGVVDFVRSLPPQPRQALRRALKNLRLEQGDIRALEGELEGFYRLRVQRYRVIFHYDLLSRGALLAPGFWLLTPL